MFFQKKILFKGVKSQITETKQLPLSVLCEATVGVRLPTDFCT